MHTLSSAIANDETCKPNPSPDPIRAKKAIHDFLEALDLNLDEGNLVKTPERVASAYIEELFAGLYEEPPEITSFPTPVASKTVPVYIRDIPVRSMCAHHLMPITGKADILAIFTMNPDDGTVDLPGLSKYARVVEHFSRRPQLQERITQQVAEFLFKNTRASAIAVRITATHHCMSHRGVNNHPEGATTTDATISYALGTYKLSLSKDGEDMLRAFSASSFSCRG